MQPFRTIPTVSDAPADLFTGGHLWIQEAVVGGPFRFHLRASGRLRVGDGERVYDPEDAPPQYRHAVRHVREECDWSALRSAVDDVESVVFFGQAMQHCGLDYEWRRTPSFLGYDVWSGTDGAYLGVDRVEHVYERLGLTPVNTFAKEVRAADFDPDDYEVPPSAWYDGPAAGVVVRNKRGACARIENPDLDPVTDEPVEPQSAEELAATLVTAASVGRVVTGLEAKGYPATFDAVYERVLEALFRETPADRFDDVDLRAFRSNVAARTRHHLS